jgi:hypothetical protein
VVFTADGTVKLGDFGLSKVLESSQQQAVSFVGVSQNSAVEKQGLPFTLDHVIDSF